MNNEQIKALESLERAFAKCKKAHLTIYCLNDTLMAMDGETVSKIKPLDATRVARAQFEGANIYSVNSHGTVVDSGAT